ncbi:ABC transporter ATP-binding protein [Spongiactinospora rosea]|uniref:ABC transporter ATP-binding protein n=1 Tax=Spongiactinospora rosea TaxID=2248750 RepID=A0A366LQU4_9ACTN|nr:ABC transporter ATP-binding protein [Spongiactinospora rosea]
MTTPGTDGPLLSVRGLGVRYGDAVTALRDVSVDVPQGGIVAVLGSNGAGKSTLLRAISGVLTRQAGRMTGGEIRFAGERIDGVGAERRVKSGIVQVPEGRRVFAHLTVQENLRAGRYGNPKGKRPGDLERVYDLFPVLGERRRQAAGLLSGGEQQMLAIGRALMAEPRLLLLDEPSLGLAPKIIDRIVDLLREIHGQGTAMLVVEQNAAVALELAEHAYVLAVGEVAIEGPAERLRGDDRVRRLYLGGEPDEEIAATVPGDVRGGMP